MLQFIAGQEGEADLAEADDGVSRGDERGALVEADLDVAPVAGGDLVHLVGHVDAGGGQQKQAGERNHGRRVGHVRPRGNRQCGYNRAMNDSMAQPRARLAGLALPGWKSTANWTAAVLLALLFLSSGIWKITDVPGWAARLTQAKAPEALSVPGTLAIGIAETLGGALLLVPRLRRWGAAICALLLVVFVAYFGINYRALQGQDCSCFPWLKRVVGPGFFIGDGAMLALAGFAWVWAKRASGLRNAALIAGAVTVFAMLSYGVEVARPFGARAPETITVEGRPFDLSRGKVFVFFFNPACAHCADAARRMSKLDWGDTRVIAAPVEIPQFAGQFLGETGLRAKVTSDFEKLKGPLGYHAYPFGAVVVDGAERATVTKFEGGEPEATLRRTGLVR